MIHATERKYHVQPQKTNGSGITIRRYQPRSIARKKPYAAGTRPHYTSSEQDDPLAACRAVLFASLVDDPSSPHPADKFPTEEGQKDERERLLNSY